MIPEVDVSGSNVALFWNMKREIEMKIKKNKLVHNVYNQYSEQGYLHICRIMKYNDENLQNEIHKNIYIIQYTKWETHRQQAILIDLVNLWAII